MLLRPYVAHLPTIRASILLLLLCIRSDRTLLSWLLLGGALLLDTIIALRGTAWKVSSLWLLLSLLIVRSRRVGLPSFVLRLLSLRLRQNRSRS